MRLDPSDRLARDTPWTIRFVAWGRARPWRRFADWFGRILYPPHGGAARSWSGVVRRADGMNFRVSTVGHIEREVLLAGVWEEGVTRIIEAFARPGSFAVDAGANIGCHTLTMSRCVGPQGSVVAFEPNPAARRDLLANLALNQVTNVLVSANAAGESAGQAALRMPRADDPLGTNQGLSSLVALETPADVVPVEVVTVDAELERIHAHSVSVVKVDVQGFDAKVIRGMERTLRNDRPVVVFEFEKWAWQQCGETLGDMLRWLEARDYEALALHEERGTLRVLDLGDSTPDHMDVLAVHKSLDRRSIPEGRWSH